MKRNYLAALLALLLTCAPSVLLAQGSGQLAGSGSNPNGGTLTNIATTAPITGGPITTTGTIACPTCVTSAASLTLNSLMIGQGSQASATTVTGTGVLTALGINVGSAGAFVTFNGALGTPSGGVATNLTGTASGLTAGNVTTNANLTGPISSSGNTTSITSQTGTGTKFVVDTSPTIASPTITGAWVAASSQTIGDGTGSKIFTINGGGSGNNNGSAVAMQLNGALTNLFGNYSAIQGGAFDSSFIIYNSSGAYRFNALAQTSAAQSGTMCYSTTVGAVTYDATLGCLASSLQFKHDWAPLTGALDKVRRMEAGTFWYNDQEAVPGQQIGLNAENIESIDDRLVGYGPDGKVRAVRYLNTIAVLVGAIQEQQKQIDELKSHTNQ